MLDNLTINRKIIVGFTPMILLLLAYLAYSFVQIQGVNGNLSVLKKHIDEQATYGTSLFLLNNINRREQLNQQYLASGQSQLIEIIKLLELDFKQLNDEQLKLATTEEKRVIAQLTEQEKSYSQLLHNTLWPTQAKLNVLLERFNNDLGPTIEKLALTVRDLGIQKNNIAIVDVGSRLAASALATRAYFNQYIANRNETSLQRALLELIATQSAFTDFTEAMKTDRHFSHALLAEKLIDVEQVITQAQQYTEVITKARSEAEDSSNSLIKEMLSQQLRQWRGLNYEAGTIQQFMSRFQWQSIITLAVAILVGLGVVLFISRLIVNSLNVLLERVSEVSQGEGDLTKRVEVNSKDETGLLANSLNTFIESIQNIIRNAQHNSEAVIDKSEQNLINATNSSNMLKEQQQKNSSVSSSVEQLSLSSSEIAQNSVASNAAVEETFASLEQGVGMVEQSVNSVLQLNQQMETTSQVSQALAQEAEEISKVLDVIKNMAEQTNLLALNAAIEAARAGDAGRGFAVVADEVRTLANRTQQSANEIEQSVTRLQSEAERVVSSVTDSYSHSAKSADAAAQTQQIFADVRASVEKIHEMSASIAAASEEQSHVTSAVRQDIEEVFNFSENIAAAANESQLASKSASESASELNQVLTKFVV